MNIKGIKSERIEIQVNPLDCINALLSYFNINDKDIDGYYSIENNILYRNIDESYHGSPSYVKHLYSDDKSLIRLYLALKELKDAIINWEEFK